MRYFMLWVAFLFTLPWLSSQSELYIPVNIQKAYMKGTRDHSGKPGPEYWQNKASYRIQVKLEPDISKVSGSQIVIYQNYSPDTLRELVLTVLSDIQNKENSRDWYVPQNILTDGVQITRLGINGSDYELGTPAVARIGTNAIVQLKEPLLPGKNLNIELDWNVVFPPGLTIRNGNYGDSTFFIAYFYPKVAVYDDLDGWDRRNYTGMAEFFGAFSDYEVFITVPQKFKVWATGELQNAEDVFSRKYFKKWQEAQKSMEVFSMIDSTNYLDNDITAKKAWNTWHFKANTVPDFAFGTSDKFLWDVVNVVVDPETGRKVNFNAAYRKDSRDYYGMAELGKKMMHDLSTRVPGVPYPFPVMTIFNGNAGMEFPMMCNNASEKEWGGTVVLAYHEASHTYFPFYVGTNERKYAWMDEGMANLFPMFYMEEHVPGAPYMSSRKTRYYSLAGQEIETNMMTLTDHLRLWAPYRQASYNKSFYANYFLYDYLGTEVFLKSLRSYIKSWAYKHPMPYDFFNSFSSYTGQNLDWFWQNWYFEKNHADLALGSFENGEIEVINKGRLFLPVVLNVIHRDGTSKEIRFKLSEWNGKNYRLKIKLDQPGLIKKIILGNEIIPDVDESNNVMQLN